MLDPNFPQMPDPMFPHISPGVCFPRYSLDYGAMVLTAGEKYAGGLHIQFVTRQGIKLDEVSLWVQGKPGWEQRNHLDPNHFDEGHPDCVRMPEIPGCFNPYPYKVFVWISPISPFCPFVTHTPFTPFSPYLTDIIHSQVARRGGAARDAHAPARGSQTKEGDRSLSDWQLSSAWSCSRYHAARWRTLLHAPPVELASRGCESLRLNLI